jgi:phosphatidylinositol kinase/protein kinase (PI-3  family)
MQLIGVIDQIFKVRNLSLWLRPYEIIATGPNCGLIEMCDGALSIDSIKKKMGGKQSSKIRLDSYFI